MSCDLQTISADANASYGPADIDPMAWSRGSAQPGQDPGTIHLTLYPELRHQRIDGVGGSFSEVGSDFLQVLPDAERSAALRALFAPDGAHFSLCRTPIGASDFGRDAYSLAETPGDLDMERFSIARDQAGILRFIRAACAIRPELSLHASPWSPPGWLKTSGSMVEGGSLIADTAHHAAYARYFVRFVQEYAAAGARVTRVCPQNEPDVPTPYPSCVMPPAQMVDLVAGHLAPALAAHCPGTAAWGGTFRMVGGLGSHECLQSAAFRQAVGGLGFQYSFTDSIRDLLRLWPDTRLMHTESVCHDGKNTWQQAAMLFDDVLAYLRAGCGAYTYWNMVLDQGGLSTWGWRQNSLITIDTQARTWRANPDLAVMSLFGRHLQPGAQRIEAFSFQRPVLAVERSDGRLVAFVANHEDHVTPLKIHLGSSTERHELPPRSMAAIVVA